MPPYSAAIDDNSSSRRQDYYYSCSLDNDNDTETTVIEDDEDSSSSSSTLCNVVSFEKDYILGEKIGGGKFGVVHKAHCKKKISNSNNNKKNTKESFVDENDVPIMAVKVQQRYIRSSRTDEIKENKAVVEEIVILNKLRSVPNVIQLIDYYMNDNYIYIVQNLADGGDLLDRLVQKQVYTETEARNAIYALLQTIHTIHNLGIVHRDVKPENILLQSKKMEAEENDTILLCDFGDAKYVEREGELLATICGTAEYMAPEIWNGIPYNGKQIDMWSVGCILYILLGGYYPFGEDTTDLLYYRVNNGDFDFEDDNWDIVSDDAKQLICNLLTIDPKQRYTSKQALESNWLKAKKNPISQTTHHGDYSPERQLSDQNSNVYRSLHNGFQKIFCRKRCSRSTTSWWFI